jgi:hypothetical protein
MQADPDEGQLADFAFIRRWGASAEWNGICNNHLYNDQIDPNLSRSNDHKS